MSVALRGEEDRVNPNCYFCKHILFSALALEICISNLSPQIQLVLSVTHTPLCVLTKGSGWLALPYLPLLVDAITSPSGSKNALFSIDSHYIYYLKDLFDPHHKV